MFLTRMHLNPHRRGTRHLVASPQRMHAAVLSGFPPTTDTGQGTEQRVLWRVDRGRNAELTLFVSSPEKPDLTHLVEQAGWPTTPDPWQTAPLSNLLDRLALGQRWAFRLTANPVHSVSQGEGRRGKRLAHVTARQQEEWLASRGGGWGFTIRSGDQLSAHVSSRSTASFERPTDGTKRRVTLGVATFDGHLEVTDAESLRSSLCRGMGRAKGYGCGLMTLAPLR